LRAGMTTLRPGYGAAHIPGGRSAKIRL